MTAISSYARVLAAATGSAAPIATVRHLHISARPFVLVPLTMAGEANAPLAAMVGTARDEPTLLVVPQPRNRDLRFAFAARLAQLLLPYVLGYAAETEELPNGPRALDAPQLLLPNRAGLEFVRLFGRSTRFRSTEGEYAVAPEVPVLGRWLTFFAERAEIPGSSLALAVTEMLTLHWATGQSALEDANLAALMGWIDPAPGLDGPAAARLAEDPRHCPPAGPTTDPDFDNELLAPAIAAYDAAALAAATDLDGRPATDLDGRPGAVARLEDLLRAQLQPTWDLVWRALDLLDALPGGTSVPGRWEKDRARFTGFHTYMIEEGFPQARRDGAVTAARRLNRIEQAQSSYEAERAFDDPLVMAEYRVTGEAFRGTVVQADPERRIPNGRGKGRMVTRPLVTVRTEDPVRLATGTRVAASSRRRQECVIMTITPVGGDTGTEAVLITLEVQNGMGRSATPAPGSVPEVGEELCYSSVLPDGVRSAAMPDAADTPWTHGGPPEPYEANEADTAEAWD